MIFEVAGAKLEVPATASGASKAFEMAGAPFFPNADPKKNRIKIMARSLTGELSRPEYVYPAVIPIPPWSISNSGSSFYTALKNNIPINHAVSSRLVLYVDYIFSVASDDLNTYMDASGPSNSIVQERPSFSNIFNGIGLFSSRYIYELDTLSLGPLTKGYISADTALIHRGF